MRRACAWCDLDMGYTCDHCGGQLVTVDIVRESPRGRKTHGLGMMCTQAQPPYVFEITQHTRTTHGICIQCAALTDAERDQLVRNRRKRFPIHETKKRGPTGVLKEATNPPPAIPERGAE